MERSSSQNDHEVDALVESGRDVSESAPVGDEVAPEMKKTKRYAKLGKVVIRIVREPGVPQTLDGLKREQIAIKTAGIVDEGVRNRQAAIIASNLDARARA